MATSTYEFDRWKTRSRSTWAWRVFKKHNLEFQRMYTSFDNSRKYTYSNLGKNNAKKEDLVTEHFSFGRLWEAEKFTDLTDWMGAFNDLENWMNLNALVAVLSNLEKYRVKS
jgi:hypothetical protein